MFGVFGFFFFFFGGWFCFTSGWSDFCHWKSLKVINATVVIDGAVHMKEVSVAWLAAMVVCALVVVIFLLRPVIIKVIVMVVAIFGVSRRLVSIIVVSTSIRLVWVLGIMIEPSPSVVTIRVNRTVICRLWSSSSLSSVLFITLIRTSAVVVAIPLILIWFAIASGIASGAAIVFAVVGLIGILLVVALVGPLIAVV